MIEKNTEIRNMYLKLKGGVFDLKGSCMEAPLGQGAKALIQPVKPKDIKTGDIILFLKDKDAFICHRVLGRFKKNGQLYFWEKADKLNQIGLVREDDIIGRLNYVINDNHFQKPPFYLKKGIVLYFLLDIFVCAYIKASDIMKRCLFFRGNNLFSHALGTTAWKLYHFFFNLITKKKTLPG